MSGNDKPQKVEDRPAETGIKINNVLTGLVLAGVLWMGTSIESIKEEMGLIRESQAADSASTRVRLEDYSRRLLRMEGYIDELRRAE